MTAAALMAIAHHVAAFTLVAALAAEVALFAPPLSAAGARRLQWADLVYGLAAGVVLVVGLLRVAYFEKGPAYYWHNAFFLLKFGAFLLAAVVSIYPTVQFLSWRHDLRAGRTPAVRPPVARRIRLCLGCELVCVVVMIACAALMARGFGFLNG